MALTKFADKGLYDYFVPASACQERALAWISQQLELLVEITHVVPHFGQPPNYTYPPGAADLLGMDAAVAARSLPWMSWSDTLNGCARRQRFILIREAQTIC